ncbi:hypothetical protein Poly24_49220 [Rosistilla carotiformis]|uniref:Uncharacterized protein n=1 Tax=Rosistilla carotiformis TaxID=2528017 RepID=A0A518K077_9BACT|nr:hypothetical protein [Rosistilla carotiformis]QDV71188.1 hypothetical protein Poly24_49220 [Rosistilla carotiformis]
MSHEKNIEVEGQLAELTKLCCDSLEADRASLPERIEPLLKSLLMSGFERQKKQPLGVELEARILAACEGRSTQRGAEIRGVANQVQRKYDYLVRWESSHPKDPQKQGTQPANISSATDS